MGVSGGRHLLYIYRPGVMIGSECLFKDGGKILLWGHGTNYWLQVIKDNVTV